MSPAPLFRMTQAGLYCEAGGFHVDPCRAVHRAVITHAHADHTAPGCGRYLTAAPGLGILQERLGPHALIDALPYGEAVTLAGVRVSLHPAGHVLGSAQVRAEERGEVWVVSGDYQTTPNPTCTPFELVPCHTFVTESTFGHPFFQWAPAADLFADIHAWWRANQAEGRASLLYAYAFGKAQRVLAGLNADVGPIFVQRDVASVNAHYLRHGVPLVATRDPHRPVDAADWSRGLFVLPPSARWRQPFPCVGPYATAMASGWMALPDGPQRRKVQRGFALSDHADHGEILAVVRACGAERIFVTHGYIETLVAELRELGYAAEALQSPRCTPPPAVPAR